MKTLKTLNVVHDERYNLFPQGTIINETDEVEGTPVVREVYGDTLTNLYALLKDRGIQPNNLEDSEENGYQILEALKLIFNDYTDSVKILTKQNNNWRLNLKLSIAPKGTIFFVRVTDNFNSGNSNLLDSENNSWSLNIKNNIKSGEDCILIFDENDSRLYSVGSSSGFGSSGKNIPLFGNTIQQFESTEKIWYFFDGILSSTFPEFYPIQNVISSFHGEDRIIKSIIQSNGYFICLSYNELDFKYELGYFTEGNLDTYNLITFDENSISQNPVSDLELIFYKDSEGYFFVSNQNGNSNSGNVFSRFAFDQPNNKFLYQNDIAYNTDFVKSNNFAFHNATLIFFGSSVIETQNINGTKEQINHYGQLVGQAFMVGNKIYLATQNNGFLLEKWT